MEEVKQGQRGQQGGGSQGEEGLDKDSDKEKDHGIKRSCIESDTLLFLFYHTRPIQFGGFGLMLL